MSEMNILFLGTSAVKPGKNNDTACALINNKYMIDTGWYSAINMLRFGVSPLDIEYIFLTHTHPDHYIGLSHYLFYLAMSSEEYSKRAALKIVGPHQDIQQIVDLTQRYLDPRKSKKLLEAMKVEIIPFSCGDILENNDLSVQAFTTKHPVPSLGYIFQDNISKKKIVYTGDTGPSEGMIINANKADLLVYEASCGVSFSQSKEHSGGPDAAMVAKKAEVKNQDPC